MINLKNNIFNVTDILLIFSILFNIILVALIISMFNTKITWYFNGNYFDHKLGNFYIEKTFKLD